MFLSNIVDNIDDNIAHKKKSNLYETWVEYKLIKICKTICKIIWWLCRDDDFRKTLIHWLHNCHDNVIKSKVNVAKLQHNVSRHMIATKHSLYLGTQVLGCELRAASCGTLRQFIRV